MGRCFCKSDASWDDRLEDKIREETRDILNNIRAKVRSALIHGKENPENPDIRVKRPLHIAYCSH